MKDQVCLAVSAEQIQHLHKIKMLFFFFQFMIIERKLQGFSTHRHHLDSNKKYLDPDCNVRSSFLGNKAGVKDFKHSYLLD